MTFSISLLILTLLFFALIVCYLFWFWLFYACLVNICGMSDVLFNKRIYIEVMLRTKHFPGNAFVKYRNDVRLVVSDSNLSTIYAEFNHINLWSHQKYHRLNVILLLLLCFAFTILFYCSLYLVCTYLLVYFIVTPFALFKLHCK